MENNIEDSSTPVDEDLEEDFSSEEEALDSEDISSEAVIADLETRVRLLEAANTLKDKIIVGKNHSCILFNNQHHLYFLHYLKL